jgi:hypothetical protein
MQRIGLNDVLLRLLLLDQLRDDGQQLHEPVWGGRHYFGSSSCQVYSHYACFKPPMHADANHEVVQGWLG